MASFKLLLVSVFTLFLLPNSVLSVCKNPPVIFNFGDSNSDTGGLVAGLGYTVNLPNGRTFFGRSTGRLSDGRLIIDFLCQNVNTSFLSPYLESMGSTFSNGANFAIVGSSTLPRYVPFALNVQIMQFLRFKSRSLELVTAGSQRMIGDEDFRRALYMIDIGQNDLAHGFKNNLSYAEVVKTIPSVLKEIEIAMKTLYDQGGRNFWVHNTGPLGCLPQKLSMVEKTSRDLDQHGCISRYNDAANLFNEGLHQLCQGFRSEMKGATVVYVDIYAIKYDLIANSSKYGFSNPLMACCGFGGPPYNYNIQITCGQPGAQVCNEGSKLVSWDGIHYTEAANNIVASKIQTNVFSTPHIAFDFFCH
ncbi:GDSL-like Lipase/Acylhydrolase superfamily protein [Heracleum sosnowskyi]|uniref:GDSL-like Lipase/Acylhydrolase superfamily protein n=2 Tax=Heracleum sosnowskyi TaxID=360622 RepID=A0AAD8JD25_9APIA|nr:GDSL-like Lipase/Acylhydrolase superfamily protein [Heracleum sosnowskyi]